MFDKRRLSLGDRLRANREIGRHGGGNCLEIPFDFQVASERYSSKSDIASCAGLFGIDGHQRRGLNASFNSSLKNK